VDAEPQDVVFIDRRVRGLLGELLDG